MNARADSHPEQAINPLALGLSALAAGLIIFVFSPAIKETALICWNDDNYSHGLLLPFLSAYLIWDKKKDIFSGVAPTKVSTLGIALGISAIPPFILGTTSGLFFVSWLAFYLAILSVVLLCLGTKRGLLLAAPILLLFLAKPIPDSLSPALFNYFQSLAARSSAFILDQFRIPVYLSGNILELPHMKLLVEEACSGLRSLLSLATISVIIAYLNKASLFQTILLFAFSILTAILLNIIRVTSTGFLAHYISLETATGFFHSFSGLAIFGIGLLVLLWFSSEIERRTK